jgi:hypothetical protein
LTNLLIENQANEAAELEKIGRIKSESAGVLTTPALSSGDIQPQRLIEKDTNRLFRRGQVRVAVLLN